MKRFDIWNGKKKEIHYKDECIQIKTRDVLFVYVGENVGFEQDGKGEDFLRPVIVLRVFNKRLFFAIPLTSKEKNGTFFQSILFHKNEQIIKSTAILVQAKTFDIKRVKYKAGYINKVQFEKIKESFKNLTLSKEGVPREIMKSLYQKNQENANFFAHKSSFIDNNTTIGDNTKIWHFSHVLSGSKIGENCSFGQNCVIGPKVNIGNGVKVQNNISIYEGVEVEDDVFLGPSMVFTNVINPRAFIVRRDEFKKTLLKKGCSVGANATIICGTTIGEYALIGAGAVINKDVLPYALMVGVPARQIGWVSKAGNRLEFDANGEAVDEFDGSKYAIIDGKVKEIS